MFIFPRNIHYVPSYVDLLNLIKYLHLAGNLELRDQVIYHLSHTNQLDVLQTVYLGELIGYAHVSRMHMLIKLCKTIGVYSCPKT